MSAFRDLHVPGNPFVLANAWDRGTARVLAALGAQAIGTSSAAHAFTLGLPDGGQLGRQEAIAHAAALSGATPLPVSADLENGFGDEPDAVAETVTAAAAAGLAGLSIEDTALPGAEPYPFDLAVQRVSAGAQAARAAAEAGPDIFLLARADGLMLGSYDLGAAIDRIKAFAAAGADGVYIPLLPDLDAVRRVCSSVQVPVNVLAAGPISRFTVAELADAGAARISLGSGLARLVHRTLVDAAGSILGEGSLEVLTGGIGGDRVDEMLAAGQRVTAREPR